MKDRPSDPATTPVPFEPALPALAAFQDDGWQITGRGAVWTAVRQRGSQTRVIGAGSARELLDRLLALDETEGNAT